MGDEEADEERKPRLTDVDSHTNATHNLLLESIHDLFAIRAQPFTFLRLLTLMVPH